jgi:hypothetical protein
VFCVDICFLLERWEGVVVIAYVLGCSLVRCEGRRTARESRVKVTLSNFLYVLLGITRQFFEWRGGGWEMEASGVFGYFQWCRVPFERFSLVDVFVGTGKGVTGNKAYPIKGRFKGVRVEKGEERFLCRPIVGSQKGRCPSFPPESCLNAYSGAVLL